MLNERVPERPVYDTVSTPGPPKNTFAVEAAVAASVFPLSVSLPEPPTMFSTSDVHIVELEETAIVRKSIDAHRDAGTA